MSQLTLNARTAVLAESLRSRPLELRITTREHFGASLLDFGVEVPGGLAAGIALARLCLANLGDVSIQAASTDLTVPEVFVRTDHPLKACLLSQYAGWKIATDSYFAMGSGPARAVVATEELFREFSVEEKSDTSVVILESGQVPDASAVQLMKSAVGEGCRLIIAVAPTASQAGNLQVVARSVETAMHKLHELKFPVECVLSGTGSAPLPPVAKNDLEGIGRTNDSILYGSTVNLWVDCEDDVIQEFGPQTPSSSSDSHGESFLSLFKAANHDFYALDRNLFSPAVVCFHNVNSGRSFSYGHKVPELLCQSFGIES